MKDLLKLVFSSFVTPANMRYMNHFNPLFGKIVALLFVLTCILPQNAVQAQSTVEEEALEEQESVTFYPISVEKALTELKQINKPIFLYIYTRFTPECNRMKKTVFIQPDVAALMNDRFFPISLELQSEEGMQLRSKYELTGINMSQYPVYLFLSSDGNVLLKDNGFKTPADLMVLANKVLGQAEQQESRVKFEPASGSFKEFFDYLQQYRNGNKQPDFLRGLAYKMREYNELYQGVVDDYLTIIGPQNYLNPTNSRFILDFADDVHSMAYSILTTNRNFFVSQFTKAEVDKTIEKAIRQFVVSLANAGNTVSAPDLKQISEKIKLSGLSNAGAFEISMKMLYFEMSEKWDEYATAAVAFLGNGKEQQPELLDNITWNFMQHTTQPDMLQKAQTWMQEAMSQKPSNFKYRETYAALLYKTGKTDKAMKETEKAIEMARQQGADYATTLKLQECMRRGKPIPADFRDSED